MIQVIWIHRQQSKRWGFNKKCISSIRSVLPHLRKALLLQDRFYMLYCNGDFMSSAPRNIQQTCGVVECDNRKRFWPFSTLSLFQVLEHFNQVTSWKRNIRHRFRLPSKGWLMTSLNLFTSSIKTSVTKVSHGVHKTELQNCLCNSNTYIVSLPKKSFKIDKILYAASRGSKLSPVSF